MSSNDVYINPANGHLIIINNGNIIDTGITPNTNCCFPQKVNDIYFGNTTVLMETCRGRCGDTAVDSLNGNVFRFNGYVWTYIGNLMGPTGYTGATGPTGYGVGVASSYINTGGDLIFVYNDGTIVNAGYVMGNTGPTGETGPTGILIESASVNSSGNLLIELSNLTEIDAGYVLGPTGVNITTGMVNATGNLILNFSNVDEQDAGYILGATGETGPTGVGIISGVISNGDLILYTTDNVGLDVGYVVGPTGYTGVGATTGGIVNNNLLLYYTNGNIQTVGNVVGATGPTGPTSQYAYVDATIIASGTGPANLFDIYAATAPTGYNIISVIGPVLFSNGGSPNYPQILNWNFSTSSLSYWMDNSTSNPNATGSFCQIVCVQ
jgi:hypothetical protein